MAIYSSAVNTPHVILSRGASVKSSPSYVPFVRNLLSLVGVVCSLITSTAPVVLIEPASAHNRALTKLELMSAPTAAKGTVFPRISGGNYFIVVTKSGYDVLEWFGGHDPDKGDQLIGGFESYGFHDIYDETTDQDLR